MLSIKKQISVKLLIFSILVVAGFFLFSSWSALAQDFGTSYLSGTQLPADDLRVIVIRLINILLGVLGVVVLGFVIYGGFLWMSSGGNPQQITKAKKVLINAVAGLVIIFMAFAITRLVFNLLEGSGGGINPPGSCTEGQVSGCLICQGASWVFSPGLPGCSLPGSDFRIRQLDTAHGGSSSEVDVYLCSAVQATTNNIIDPTTAPGNATITAGTDPVVTSLHLTSRALELVPSENLLPNTTYTARYETALSDTSGLALSACAPSGCSLSGSEFTWNFTTGTSVDPNPPAIISASPVADPASPAYPDRNVSLDRVISVNFSESISLSSLDDGSGSPVPGNIRLERLSDRDGIVVEAVNPADLEVLPRDKGFDLRWRAPNLYQPFTWYLVTVQNVTDLCGNAMAEPLVWKFQTNDRAPGISSHYPTGNNICPEVGVISLTFNTSMYYDVVSVAVDDGISVFGAALRPVDLAPGPYQVSLPEGTWAADPASDFRVFTLTLNNSLSTETTYAVNVVTDRVINTDGDLLADSWNFQVSDTASCSCAPYISALNPSQGFLGQCVTITGQCFNGAVPGNEADPRHATVTGLAFDSVPAVIGSQASNFVTTSVPTGFLSGDRPRPQVTITYNDPALGTISSNNNSLDFYISSETIAQGPCLLGLNPVQACFDDQVNLAGSRFGPDPGGGSRSTDSHHVTYADATVRVPESQVLSWGDNNVSTLVPAATVDGQVAITVAGNQSNSVPFDLSCGAGSSCSLDPLTCSPSDAVCGPGLICNDSCICESVAEPAAPVVVNRAPTCSQSCPNVALWAEFNLDMDPATINGQVAHISVRPCGIDCTAVNLGSEISYADISYDPALRQINIAPVVSLNPNTRYRVSLSPAITSSAGVPLGGLNFNSDAMPGNDSYSWTFATKDTACALSGVTISPTTATADRLNQNLSYNAYAEGSNQQCGSQTINRFDLAWTWTLDNPLVASISNNDPAADGRVDPVQTALILSEGVTNITAAGTDGINNFDDTGSLTVNVITCNETTDCTQAGVCGGSVCDESTKTCTPVLNSLSPASGPVGRWVTLMGCYFGSSQGSGSVDFGFLKAGYPACGGGTWQNSQIIVEVPGLVTGNAGVAVNTGRGLTSNSLNFNVTNDCSGALVPPDGIPGICRLSPVSAAVNSQVTVAGVRFGNTNDTADDNVTYAASGSGRTQAAVGSWSASSILTTVPGDATTGQVMVTVNSCPSNGVDFSLGVGPGTACSSNAGMCEPSDNRCAPGSGLYCANDCTCQFAPAPGVLSVSPSGTNVCRNAVAMIEFNQLMDHGSLAGSVILEKDNGAVPCASAAADQLPAFKGLRYWLSQTLNIFKKVFYKDARAQGTNWCPVAAGITAVDEDFNNDNELTVLADRTRVTVTPSGGLEPVSSYRLRVLDTVRSGYGASMAAPYTSAVLTTTSQICQIDHVTVTISPPGQPRTSDIFFCGGSDSCPGDQDGASGNQHRYAAEAYDASSPDPQVLQADYHWTEVDPGDIYTLNNPDAQSVLVTASQANGRGTLVVAAEDNTGLNAGSASASVTVTSSMCANPWPSPTNYPYLNNDGDFSFWYCRDRGSVETGDDLPALEFPPIATASPDPDIAREYLFLFDPATTNTKDAIAIRLYDNSDYLSPLAWYRAKVRNQGSPQSITVDGYDAIRDGRTVYVSPAQGSVSSVQPNIFVISYSQNPDADTVAVLNQILAQLRFTLAFEDLNTCAGDMTTFCLADETCQSQALGFCQIEATKLRRDAKRVMDLSSIKTRLADYNVVNGGFPQLTGGTYLPGASTSRWPTSWSSLGTILGGSLPLDPQNTFASCPADFEPQACWDSANQAFACADGSHIYTYAVAGTNLNGTACNSPFCLWGNLELDSVNWQNLLAANLSGAGADRCLSFRMIP